MIISKKMESNIDQNTNTPTNPGFHLDENTTADKLRELAKSDDESSRMAVSQHLNTPPDVLIDLFSEFSYLVLTHPLLDLIFLENPNFFNQLWQKYNLRIFNYNELPLIFMEWAANSSNVDIRKAIAYNKLLPEHIIEKLAFDKDETVRIAVSERNSLPIHILESLAADEKVTVRFNIAKHDSTPSDILEQLATDIHASVRSLAVFKKNPHPPF
jgi:hypothetical protein